MTLAQKIYKIEMGNHEKLHFIYRVRKPNCTPKGGGSLDHIIKMH